MTAVGIAVHPRGQIPTLSYSQIEAYDAKPLDEGALLPTVRIALTTGFVDLVILPSRTRSSFYENSATETFYPFASPGLRSMLLVQVQLESLKDLCGLGYSSRTHDFARTCESTPTNDHRSRS